MHFCIITRAENQLIVQLVCLRQMGNRLLISTAKRKLFTAIVVLCVYYLYKK